MGRPDLDAMQQIAERATGNGWEAAYRQDVSALVAYARALEAADPDQLHAQIHDLHDIIGRTCAALGCVGAADTMDETAAEVVARVAALEAERDDARAAAERLLGERDEAIRAVSYERGKHEAFKALVADDFKTVRATAESLGRDAGRADGVREGLEMACDAAYDEAERLLSEGDAEESSGARGVERAIRALAAKGGAS